MPKQSLLFLQHLWAVFDESVAITGLTIPTRGVNHAAGEDGHLIIPTDSLQLLPARLPYELLGPCILAAVDSHAAAVTAQHSSCMPQASQSCRQQTQHPALQHPHMGLQLCGLDLQQPLAAPLATCFAAYPFLRHLGLQELNIDTAVAGILGSLIQSPACRMQGSCCSSSSLIGLGLKSVFMCDLAWQAFSRGLAAGCQLQTLRCGTWQSLCYSSHQSGFGD